MRLKKQAVELAMARSEMDSYNLAKRSKLSYNTIRKAKNQTDIKPTTAGKIAKALGVDVGEIVEAEE